MPRGAASGVRTNKGACIHLRLANRRPAGHSSTQSFFFLFLLGNKDWLSVTVPGQCLLHLDPSQSGFVLVGRPIKLIFHSVQQARK